MKYEDLTGIEFGMLTVLGLDKEKSEICNSQGRKVKTWICQCECGEIKSVTTSKLNHQGRLTCGSKQCKKKMKENDNRIYIVNNIIGKKYGKLLVKELIEINNHMSNCVVKCVCDCGNVKKVSINYLKNSDTPSCGCHISEIRKDKIIEYIRDGNSLADKMIEKYGEDALEKYWSNKNTINPYDISAKSHLTYAWFKCPNVKHHEEYKVSVEVFLSKEIGHECKRCSNKKALNTSNFTLLDKYPQSWDVWSDKNPKLPDEYTPNSTTNVWWKCETGKHEDYRRKINASNIFNFKCPICVQIERVRLLFNR